MNIHDIDPTTARRATATGRSRRWTARATAVAAAALAGGAAVSVPPAPPRRRSRYASRRRPPWRPPRTRDTAQRTSSC